MFRKKDSSIYLALQILSLMTLMRGDFIKILKILVKNSKEYAFITEELQKIYNKLRNGVSIKKSDFSILHSLDDEMIYLIQQLAFSESNISKYFPKYLEVIYNNFIEYIIRENEIKVDKITIIGGFISFFPLILSIILLTNKIVFNTLSLILFLPIYHFILFSIIKIVFKGGRIYGFKEYV